MQPDTASKTTLNYTVHDVFTPTQPARLTFIDREDVNTELVDALETPGTQIVVYGRTGSGKTTLLTNKLSETYEGHITSHCMKGMTFEQIVIEAFDQLAPFYESDRLNKLSEAIKGSVQASYLIIKSSLEASKTKEHSNTEKRALPPQLTPTALGRFLGASNQCWVIEDFHKVEVSEREKLAQLLKVFMDLSDEHKNLKIVCLGAVDTARQVIDFDPEMKERVAEIAVPLMTDAQLYSIITKGEALLNIKFTLTVRKKVVRYACGTASICHRLCLNMCTSANIKKRQTSLIEIGDDYLDKAVEKYISNSSDTLKNAFDKALKIRRNQKFESSKLVIEALSVAPERGLARLNLLRRIQENHPSYTDYILKPHLARLTESDYGAIIRYDSDSGLYSFRDQFHRAYAQSIQHNNDQHITKSQTNRKIFITLKEDFHMVEFEDA